MGSITHEASSDATVQTIPLGLYLWTRIRQQGTQSIMGVPGDMNLELLDYIKSVPELKWIGNTNELNAAYAADGYARTKGCPGAITTTMGVGEMSALNGIAGAYTEQVKVIHVVGTTGTELQQKRAMIHHCLGSNPDHRVFDNISSHVRCAHAWIDNQDTAAAEIDRVIRECWLKSMPVYIFVPMDFVHIHVPARHLEQSIDLSYPVNLANEARAVQEIVNAVTCAEKPLVLVDGLTSRHAASKQAKELVNLLNLPVFTAPMGKGIIDETLPVWCGIYAGEVSLPGIKQYVEQSDCIINLGPFLSDSNTGGHTRQIFDHQAIMLEPDSCTVMGQKFDQVYLRPLLTQLLSAFKKVDIPSVERPAFPCEEPSADAAFPEITQSWIWKRFGQFTRPGDIVIVESGTAQFGFPDAVLRNDIKYITQVYFGSIGYSVGSCLGAALAQSEIQAQGGMPNGRTILIVGDGSLQLTVQEIATMLRHQLSPLLFIINNNGFAIERAIHGPEEEYNNISPWRHQLLLETFGARNGRANSREVKTKKEMEMVLDSEDYTKPREIQLLEVFMATYDYPWRLTKQIGLINARVAAKKI
ncbi:thiamine diphosphate-binding protein [Penicillium mononematosum]|uniref:thiamine diphosphate-binding protein n=1 Tax=Penicillium mononematosum TaxID=268346 RepID=UPI002549BE30|nr:thiamine diphosphate-binding protein [Penicillium mononematosum]KAJ6191350.1 thiamine diphosphate-binding protein [Penicillium mononematosum]